MIRSIAVTVTLAALVTAGFAPGPGAAQSPVAAPAAAGMGTAAYDMLACGPDALAANPAALARDCAAPVRVMIMPTLGLGLLDSGAGAEIWRHRAALTQAFRDEDFGTGIEPEARDAILARIPADGYRHRNRVDLPVAQAGFGRANALSLSFTSAVRGTIARDLAELLLEGYEPGRTDYSVEGTDEWAHGYWTAAFGHARTVPGIASFGVTARVMSGTFLTRWQAFGPDVQPALLRAEGRLIGAFAGDNLFTANLFDFRPPDGFGFSLDVGAMRELGPLRVGLAVQNLIHGMRWSDDINLRTITFTATPDGTTLETDEAAYDPATATAEERQVAMAVTDDARFPTRLRASAAFEPLPWVTLAGGGTFVVGAGELDREWDRRVGVGAQVRPLGFLRANAGLATSLDGALDLSAGLEVDLARTRIGAGFTRVTGEVDGLSGWRIVAGISRF